MARCTAPVNGHRTASGRANCPVCGGSGNYSYRGSYSYDRYSSVPSRTSSSSSTRSEVVAHQDLLGHLQVHQWYIHRLKLER